MRHTQYVCARARVRACISVYLCVWRVHVCLRQEILDLTQQLQMARLDAKAAGDAGQLQAAVATRDSALEQVCDPPRVNATRPCSQAHACRCGH